MYLDALDYAKNVADRISRISQQEYFLRNNRETKCLIDEEWPLATLGKILYHPNRLIQIEYYGPESLVGYDASIRVVGSQKSLEGWDDETPVEITSAYYKNSYLVREEMGTKGISFGPNGISRNANGDVESKCVARNSGDDFKEFIPELILSLDKKYSRVNPYPDNCLLVCALFAEREPWALQWSELLGEVNHKLKGRIKYKTMLIDTFGCRCFGLGKS